MPLQTEYYRQIMRSFVRYLELLGYADRGMYGAKYFLEQMELKGVLKLEQITSPHIKEHYAYLQSRLSAKGTPLSPHTIQGYLHDIRQLLRWAERTGQIALSPMAGMRFPTPPASERAILTKLEIKTLYAACQEPVERLTLSLFYGCGLRASEGAKLNLKDINVQGKLLYVRQGKGRKRRVIPLTEKIVQHIENYVQQQRPLKVSRFTKEGHSSALALNRYGRRMQGCSYRKIFKDLLRQQEQIRQDVSLHSLRHSIATHLLADGMRLERVRDFLGHDCLETTQIYVRINPDQL
ncbi:MAG: tyrosine-type recombinase/integrase [Bacteroidota bacterium]